MSLLALRKWFIGALWLVFAAATARPDSVIHKIPTRLNDTLPTPSATKELLFYIQRTSNTNTIIYDVNFSATGKPDEDDPIHVYWIRYSEESQHEELSYIQRTFAYGVNARKPNAGIYEFSFVSYKKMKMYMQYSEADKGYIVWMQRGPKKVRVNRFFVKIDGGTFWFPKVTFIEIKGTELSTGKEYVERFKP